MTEHLPRVAVGMCTHKRPQGMVRAIEHVGTAAEKLDQRVVMIVVDNDGNDPAVAEQAAAAAERAGLELRFAVERTPGISAARNAVFGLAEELDIDLLAMLDDDEWPTPGWLVGLYDRISSTAAHVVGGPVSPVFPQGSKVESLARFWSVRPQLLEGRTFVFCTCNFIIDLRAIRDMPRPLFAHEFGLSGGGDVVFFRSLFHAGHPMEWADQALMLEEMPQSRSSVEWMRQRRFRIGNHAANWETRDQGRLKPILKSIALTLRLPIYPLMGREPDARLYGWLFEMEKIRGRWNAHRGKLFMEYKRSADTGLQKDCR